jgi:hypothetical protein
MTTPEHLRDLGERQLIDRIAREVMGWVPTEPRHWWLAKDGGRRRDHHWNPLVDWNLTMEVVERLRTYWGARFLMRTAADDRTTVEFVDRFGLVAGRCTDRDPRRALCLAALLAVAAAAGKLPGKSPRRGGHRRSKSVY